MHDLERDATLVTQDTRDTHLERIRTHEKHLRLPPGNPFIEVTERERVVEDVSAYIEKQRNNRNDEWAEFIAKELDSFKRLNYSFKLNLFLNAVDYCSGAGTESKISIASSKDIKNYTDLYEYLGNEDYHLRARILSFVHGNEVASRLKAMDKWYLEDRAAIALSFPVRGRMSHISSERLFRITSAMICAILGCYWGIDARNLAQLFHLEFTPAFLKPKRHVRASPRSLPSQVSTRAYSEQITILEDPAMFQGDYEVYTTRPHCSPPEVNLINVYCSLDGVGKPYRMVTSCSFPGEVEQKPIDVRDLCNLSDSGNVDTIALSPAFALSVLEKKSLKIHRRILEDLKFELKNFKYKCRSRPSIAKLEWLLYAGDCIETMVQSINDLGRNTSTWPCAADAWTSWSEKFDKERDSVALLASMVQKDVEESKRMIKEILDVSSNSRGRLLTILAALYVPLSFTTGLFGMNIQEINNSSPRYWHALALGIPLALLTALLPIYFNAVWRLSYRTVPALRRVSQTPHSDKILMPINFALATLTIILCAISPQTFKWGPVVGFSVWALFAWAVTWLRESRMFWFHWFVSILVLPVLVALAVEDAAIWSLVPILLYWVLRDWLSIKELCAVVWAGVRNWRAYRESGT